MANRGDDDRLEAIEQAHPEGLSVQQIAEACGELGERVTEATFRKYVQLGLLPRSVRVGRKGKHRGSQGLYPVGTVRQLLRIRRLMKQGFTIEEIQRRSLLLRGDIDALDGSLERVLRHVARAASEVVERDPSADVDEELDSARSQASQLIDTLRALERRLAMHTRMERAAV